MNDQKVLLVDAGNTRLKWSVLQHGQRTAQAAQPYNRDPDKIHAALQEIRQVLGQIRPGKLVIVHVLGAEFSALLSKLCQKSACELHQVNSKAHNYGINIAYPNPAHLGADRLVGLLAARKISGARPVIMIDCGTAVTLDGLAASGQHLGGLIIPGLQLLSNSLIRQTTAKHMDQAIFGMPTVFADNTAQGMGSGCLFSLVGAIEGICLRMQQEMTDLPVKIICGGDAKRLHKYLQGDYRLEPEALMDGLQFVAESL